MTLELFLILTYIVMGLLLFLVWRKDHTGENEVVVAMRAVIWLPLMFIGILLDLFEIE